MFWNVAESADTSADLAVDTAFFEAHRRSMSSAHLRPDAPVERPQSVVVLTQHHRGERTVGRTPPHRDGINSAAAAAPVVANRHHRVDRWSRRGPASELAAVVTHRHRGAAPGGPDSGQPR